MKAKHILTIITLLVGVLTLLLVLTNFNPPAAFAQDHASATTLQQSTPTAQVLNGNEIGSTNGIMIMGFVIVLIVTLPLIFQKRK